MIKQRFFLILALLLIGIVRGVAADPGLPDDPSGAPVEPQVWEALRAAPDRQATFVVVMREGSGGGAESAISSQMGLAGVLQILQGVGSVNSFQAYYGENAILIAGTGSAVRFLAGWPDVAAVRAYQPGQFDGLRSAGAALAAPEADGHFSGVVTAESGGAPLSGVLVTAYRQTAPTSWIVQATTTTGADGSYDIGGLPGALPDGELYRARFEDLAGNYASEFYNNVTDFNFAQAFTVKDGQTTSGINAALATAGKIAGTVTALQGGGGVPDMVVSAWHAPTGSWRIAASDLTAANGTYAVGGLAPGTYRVRFSDPFTPPNYVDEYYDNKVTIDEADDVSVTAGGITANINAALGGYGKIAGTVRAEDGTTSLADITVDVYEPDGTGGWQWASFGETDAAGQYEAGGLVTRDYRVEFSDALNPAQYATEYYDNKATVETGNDVHVELGATTGNINAGLALTPMTVNVPLASGWNLMSLSVNPSTPAPADALSSIAGNYDVVWAYDGCDAGDPWKRYAPGAPGNDLTAMAGADGYWLDANAAVSLQVDGERPIATSITLCTDWNLIGYPAGVSKPVNEVLAGIAGKYDLVYGYDAANPSNPWKIYDPNFPVGNTLETMQPGRGYWILMNQNAMLTVKSR